MLLGNLLKLKNKKYFQIPIKGISFNSKRINRGDVFFAIEGKKTSGNRYINEALTKGASAIVSNKKIKLKNIKVPIILVDDARKALAIACSNFYNKKPSNIIAVTGTNGKSSVADFFCQIFSFSNIPAASIGTLGVFSKNYNKKTNLTSLDSLSLHKHLQNIKKNKVDHVILEASSHGLAQKRLDNLNINIGIFTNLSHDHLDYHYNMKSYFASKMYLFKNLLNKNSQIISDEENKEFKALKRIAQKRKIKMMTMGKNTGDIKILNLKYDENKQIVKVLINSKIFILEIPLIGFFQVKNLLMAILAATRFGIDYKKIFEKIHKIKAVRGRLECVANLKNNCKIIVDFAHTPDALEQSLIALKKQFKKEIIIVFGCGGERDKKKRLRMGKIAKKYCQKIFITDDNPRNENPEEIRKSIIKGCKAISFNIANREKAIETAIKQLEPNQILLIAGKGHEETQDYGNKIIKFSDQKVIKKVIKKMKISTKKKYWSNYLIKKALNDNRLKNINYNGVSINSKTIKKGNLFFAIKGTKTDGHKFVEEATKKGAIKSIVHKKVKKVSNNKIIKVKNTFYSLNQLAKITRNNTKAKIIAITGSVGKTTLKNLASFALKNYGKTYHSPLSYNNKFGVPLSLGNLKRDTEFGVFEAGMDKKGEINNLTKIIQPEIGVITNIAEAHLKNFNNLKGIAKAKAEIIDNIISGGYIILNKDDRFYNFLFKKAKEKSINIVSFGMNKKADISLLKIKKNRNNYMLKILVKKEIFYFNTKHASESFVNNILACISILFVLNLNLTKLEKKFTNFSIPEGRGDIKKVKKFGKKFNFVDESYNANPLSMMSAIKNVNLFKKKRNAQKLVFLGDMLELGKKSKKLHKKLSKIINKSNVDKVFVYGNYIKETFNSLHKDKKGKIFNNIDEAYNHFRKIIHNNDLLMVKASNATGLSHFSKNIKKGYSGVI